MSIPYTQVMKGTMGLQPFSAEWHFTSPLKEELRNQSCEQR